jgi:transcriptional regulator with PAS, ATPase and Fis domain
MGEECDMPDHAWVESFPAAVTVCDERGIILEMNDRSAAVFAADGGRDLIGSDLADCHPGVSRAKLTTLLESRRPNVYTIEKNGVKKLIYQSPWYRDGKYAGFVELSLEIPFEVPHFVRG